MARKTYQSLLSVRWFAPEPHYESGYGNVFSKQVEQTGMGCDFDFRISEYGRPVPGLVIN